MQAQDKKLFTLEDLNFGGTNYRNMRPENRYTTWWGDELMHLDVESVSLINKVNASEKHLFTLSLMLGLVLKVRMWSGHFLMPSFHTQENHLYL